MTTVPLRRLVDPRRPLTYGIVQAGPNVEGGVPYIRPTDMSDAGGVADESVLLRTSPEIAAAYERASVQAGDIVISIGPSFGKVMIVPPSLAGANLTQGTARLAPGEGVVARWMYWVLQAHPSTEFWTAVAAGGTFRALNLGPLGETPVTVVPLNSQRRIADFLDDRVSRIDRVIAARRRQLALVREEGAAELEQAVTEVEAVERPLSALTDATRPIQYGIVLPGPDFDGGVPIIKGGDIGSGRLSRGELNRTDPEIEARYARSRVRPGDYVIAIRGSVGELAVVPESLPLANLTQDSARLAPQGCDPAWFAATVRCPYVQGKIAERVTGSTVMGINIGDLRRVPVPVPNSAHQARIGNRARLVDAHLAARTAGLARSIDLLAEYKSSLITAAVTGVLDVTTAGSAIPA